jgi:D-3-phosphoglycerate dehydrogenase / 2-oxoglutarate reductase
MSNMKRILIADDMHENIIPLLLEVGYEIVYSPDITRSEILSTIHDFDGLIIRSKTDVDKEIIDAAPKLKFVARAGAGMDKVDSDYLKSKNILAINAPEGNRDSLAEHTLGMLLSLMHKINSSFDQVKQGVWNRDANRGIEIKGKVVGIYGVGNMGMAFAEKLKGLDCEVIGYDKYDFHFSNEFIKAVNLEELMKRTEILSLHIPLNNDTRYLFDLSYFHKFEKLKVFINTARGEIVKTKDLISILEEGKIYGAGLDVLENEKPASYTKLEEEDFKRLISYPNVLITPHVGGWTHESYERISQVIVNKLKAAIFA